MRISGASDSKTHAMLAALKVDVSDGNNSQVVSIFRRKRELHLIIGSKNIAELRASLNSIIRLANASYQNIRV